MSNTLGLEAMSNKTIAEIVQELNARKLDKASLLHLDKDGIPAGAVIVLWGKKVPAYLEAMELAD